MVGTVGTVGTYTSAFQKMRSQVECNFRLGQLRHLGQRSTAADIFTTGDMVVGETITIDHLVGQLVIGLPCKAAAPEPPKRRRRARSRRRRRLPFQTNGVGCSFQPATLCSSHSITS